MSLNFVPKDLLCSNKPALVQIMAWHWTDDTGWVGLWGFLWWAPSAKGKDHHGVSSGWSSVCHRSNTGLSSTQYEQIPIILGVWPFWLASFFFSCDQAALQMVFSVRPSVRPSVTPFWLCSHHRIIMKFSGVITNDQSKVHTKGQGQRSKVKVTEVTTQLNRFRTVTPDRIHIWWWNDAYSLMLLRRGALLFFKVIRQISRSHGSKNHRIWPKLGVSGL